MQPSLRLLRHIRPAFGACAVFFVMLGLAYPAAETAIGQGIFSHQANGSLTASGSTLIGQKWTSPRWFVGRPDADNPMASGGTNLGPRSETLVKDVKAQIAQLRRAGIAPTSDLVTTSGSGLDPDIAPADAYAQVSAVAKARGLSAAAVRHLVTAQIQRPEFGFLGSASINVLQLNEALARMR